MEKYILFMQKKEMNDFRMLLPHSPDLTISEKYE